MAPVQPPTAAAVPPYLSTGVHRMLSLLLPIGFPLFTGLALTLALVLG